VSGAGGPVSDVNVTINSLTHSRPAEVGIVLVDPSGHALNIQDDAGVGTSGISGVTYTLDDQATSQLPADGIWAAGSYRPSDYYSADVFADPGVGGVYDRSAPAGSDTLDGTFANFNPNGTWKLFVEDFGFGHPGSIDGGWSLTIASHPDLTPPDTSVASGPDGLVASTAATFTFTATETSTFECSLDGSAFALCPSPQTYSGLADGAHTVAVRAHDEYGNVDPTPATSHFTVDATGPTTSIDSGPSGVITSSTASFGFSANEAVNFECRLDDAGFSPCTSAQDYSDLADGLHVFQLRATDAAGNADTTHAARAFTVQRTLPGPPPDKSKPTVSVTKPKVKKGKTKAKISFSGADNSTGGLSFMCSLDGNAAKTCTSPTTYKHLKPGTHSFFVVAQDPTGNLSAPASTNFKVKPKKK
jgi:hypothetical protein